MATQSAAFAATTVVAGNGVWGYNGDNMAATSAHLGYPQDPAVDAAGNLYFTDNSYQVARQVDTGGTIHTIYGTPNTQKNVANGGMSTPRGVAATQDGGLYIADTGNNVIWYRSPSGATSKYAGKSSSGGGCTSSTNGDGYAVADYYDRVVLCGPQWLFYDDNSGDLYISEGGRIRYVHNGIINTFAGTGTSGYRSTDDGGLATNAQISSTDLAVGNGRLYFVDSGRVRIVALSTNVITTVAGNGTYNDSGDGGLAINAALKNPHGIAVDLVGNIYVGTDGGLVRKINPAGIISTVAAIEGSINGMDRDRYGNIYISTNWYSKVYKITNASTVAVGTPSAAVTPTTPMYKMKVSFGLTGVSCPAAASVNLPSTNVRTTKTLCAVGETAPTSASVDVPVTSLNPETGYPVKVTVDDGNGTSPTASGTLTTPKRPVWIGVGDSYSSGHHEDQDVPCNLNGTSDPNSFQTAEAANLVNGSYAGTCEDPKGTGVTSYLPNDSDFSWVTRAKNSYASSQGIPDQWKPIVLVLARSGALAVNYTNPALQDDDNCNGCGEQAAMVSALQARAGSWNVVTVEGGANDSKFGDRLADFYHSTLGQGQPWVVTSRSNCPDTDQLDAKVLETRDAVRQGLTDVLNTAQQTDPNVRRVLLTYPYVLNPDTGSSVCGGDWPGATPAIGAFHVSDDLDTTITGISVSGVRLVELRTASGFASNPLNDTQQTRYFGYPHPNSAGQDAIASAVVSNLLS